MSNLNDSDNPLRSLYESGRITPAGQTHVDTTISCILTRFRLASPLWLLPFYLSFRRVRREAIAVQGLLKAVFLIENSRTCYTLSIWANDAAMREFKAPSHVEAAGRAFGATWRSDRRRAEIWSAQFRLCAVSSHNLNWEGFDLKSLLGTEWRNVDEVRSVQLGRERVS